MCPDFEESREEPEKRSTGNGPYAYTFGILGYRNARANTLLRLRPRIDRCQEAIGRTLNGSSWLVAWDASGSPGPLGRTTCQLVRPFCSMHGTARVPPLHDWLSGCMSTSHLQYPPTGQCDGPHVNPMLPMSLTSLLLLLIHLLPYWMDDLPAFGNTGASSGSAFPLCY